MESCELCRGSAFSNRNFASASSRISGERCEKKVGIFWSARIGLRYRVIGKERAEAWPGSGLAVMIVTKRSSNRERCCFGFEIVLLFPSAISHIVAAAVATWQIRK